MSSTDPRSLVTAGDPRRRRLPPAAPRPAGELRPTAAPGLALAS
jgi:hypothetical protein